MSDLLEVGDTLVVKGSLAQHCFVITRVTKTLAMSKRKSDGFEYKFKRQISSDMAHPYTQWNTQEYSVIKKK